METRTAVVTGASAGIGRAIAARLLQLGLRVIGVARSLPDLRDAQQGFGRLASRFQCCEIDVSDGPRLMHELAGLGPFHAVIANAGIVRQARLADPDSVHAWREVLSVNLDGVFHTLRATEPHMPRGGRIVVVSSALGTCGRAGFGAYAASKHAVLGLMKCLARELAPREITVNAVCPGWVDTDMARADLERFARDQRQTFEEVRSEITARIPIGRFVRPSEVAHLVAFLVSDEAGAITGQSFHISGGEL